MKGYLINSLTPFISSELDSRLVRTGNRIVNVIYALAAIVSILYVGLLDPFNFGHLPTAAVLFLIWGAVGVMIQRGREADNLEKEKEYEATINMFLLQQQNINLNINTDQSVSGKGIPAYSELEVEKPMEIEQKKNKRGRKKLSEDINPFHDSEYESFLRKVLDSIPDNSLQGTDVNAIARALAYDRLNKGNKATFGSSIPTMSLWFIKNYPTKIMPDLKPITMIKSNPKYDCLQDWHNKLNRP